ncbi:hypothetical protein M758_6G184100 [Ceratodon purpureus]|nr:hypothetical protein M758_6G184100 [Ceratodon purpureus]
MYCDGIPLAHLANPLQLCCCSVAVEIFQNWDFLALERRPLGVTLPLVYWYITGQSVEMATLLFISYDTPGSQFQLHKTIDKIHKLFFPEQGVAAKTVKKIPLKTLKLSVSSSVAVQLEIDNGNYRREKGGNSRHVKLQLWRFMGRFGSKAAAAAEWHRAACA